MIAWILGGAAAVGLGGYYFWKKSHETNPAAHLLDFSPFTLRQNGEYTIRVLAPTDLDAYVQKMWKPDVAVVGQVAREGGPQVVQGPGGPKKFQSYLARTVWRAKDATFTQASAVEKMGIAVPAGMQANRALAAALYVAAAMPPGQEKRLRFFPVAIVAGP